MSITGVLALPFIVAACASADSGITDNYVSESSSTQESPLNEFLGDSVWNDEVEFRRLAEELNVRREELVAQCMLAAGFTYLPDLQANRWVIGNAQLEDTTRSDNREWVMQYGFGIASGDRFISSAQRVGEDPNADYVASLTESEQLAYWLALDGPADNVLPENPTPSDWADWRRSQGCWGVSQQQAQDESPLFMQHNEEFAPLFDAIDQMHIMVSDNSEFAAIHTDWAGCMADNGHVGYSRRGEVIGEIIGFFTALDAQQLSEQEHASRLSTLQDMEIELALADFDCRQSTQYDSRLADLQFRIESQFVADHRAALEAYRDAVAQRD